MRPLALEKIPAPITRARPKFAAKFAAIAEDEEEAQVVTSPSKPEPSSATIRQTSMVEPIDVTPVVQVCIELPEQDQPRASEKVLNEEAAQAQSPLNSLILDEPEAQAQLKVIEPAKSTPMHSEPLHNRASHRSHSRTSSFGQISITAQATRLHDTSDCKSGLSAVSLDNIAKPALTTLKSPRASLWVPAQPSRLRCGSFDKLTLEGEHEYSSVSAGTSPSLSARSSECDFSQSRCITPSIDSDSDLAFGSRMYSQESAISAVAHASSAFARMDDLPSSRLKLAQRQRLSDFDIQTADSTTGSRIPTNHNSLAAPECLIRQRSHSHGSLRRDVLLSRGQANHSAV